MTSIFNNNRSKKYTVPFYIFIFFLFSITISGFILPEKTNYKTIKAGETCDVNNNQLLLQSINKTDEFVYLEIIDQNWLSNIEGYKFKAGTKENANYKTTPEIKVSYKGYYLVKISLKNNYSSFKLTTIKDTKDIEDVSNKEVSIYFNEHQLKVNNNYEELKEKEYITKYQNLLIENTELEIKEFEDKILISQKRIEKNKEEIELIKGQMEFQTKDEIENSESIISSKTIIQCRKKIIYQVLKMILSH